MAVDIYYSCDCTNEEDEDEDEDEYIDMEVNPLYNTNNNNSLLRPHSPPPPHPQSDDYGHHHQFEFQMSTASHSLDHTPLPTTSPADELFYMGKLLPLHLPPRLHTIESILRATSFRSKSDELLITPTTTITTSTPITPVTTTTTTPFLSCTASPVESRHVSGEIVNRDEYLRDYTNGDYHGGEYEHQLMVEISDDESDSEEMISSESRKSWVRKLSMIKHVLIGSKLKGSRAYLRNMFNKSVCSHRSSASVAMMNNDIIKPPPVLKENFNKQRKNPAAVADTGSHENQQTTKQSENAIVNESGISSKICHRRSFSGVFKRRQSASMAKISATSSSTSSSFSSSTSSGSGNSNEQVKVVLKRSGTTTTTTAAPSNNITVMECPIQGAIAYCKRSNNDQDVMMMKSRKTLSEVGFLSGFGSHDSSTS